MAGHHQSERAISTAEQDLVLAELEHEQLAEVKKHRLPRRKLKRLEAGVLWSLRVYVLFMVAVVIYQIWSGK